MSKDFRETFERRIKKWPSGHKPRIQMSKGKWENFIHRIWERKTNRDYFAKEEQEDDS